MQQKVTLIFDIGKTNKKYFLFDEDLCEIQSEYVQIPEITDDDGDTADDLTAVIQWMLSVVEKIKKNQEYEIEFINFSAYGATLVHLDKYGQPCTPLYNYLKEFPEKLKSLFVEKHGSLEKWCMQTASPSLGMLNAGLQLFWLKYHKPQLFGQIHKTLFLPQYLSYVLTGVLTNEYTGIGCHTGMWDFEKNDFHEWMYKEDFTKLFAPISHNSTCFPLKEDNNSKTGIGIHDSSAALIPYMKKIAGPFLLLSTGTWSICLNPFNDESLTATDLANDCLCYLRPDGKQVKASRYLLGKEFSAWEQVIANVFDKSENYHHKLKFDSSLYNKASSITSSVFTSGRNDQSISFTKETEPNLESFDNYEEAYHQLVFELALIQREKIY
ncbi:MAG: FGGY family carbohydrate kinase, partial [Ginsengibacter sp.]